MFISIFSSSRLLAFVILVIEGVGAGKFLCRSLVTFFCILIVHLWRLWFRRVKRNVLCHWLLLWGFWQFFLLFWLFFSWTSWEGIFWPLKTSLHTKNHIHTYTSYSPQNRQTHKNTYQWCQLASTPSNISLLTLYTKIVFISSHFVANQLIFKQYWFKWQFVIFISFCIYLIITLIFSICLVLICFIVLINISCSIFVNDTLLLSCLLLWRYFLAILTLLFSLLFVFCCTVLASSSGSAMNFGFCSILRVCSIFESVSLLLLPFQNPLLWFCW